MIPRSTMGVAAVALAAAGGAYLAALPGAPRIASAEEPPTSSAKRAERRSAIVEAVEKSAPAVVSVGTTRIVPYRYFSWGMPRQGQQELRGLGSGVIVHPAGLVITNAHVINEADQVVVRLTGLDQETQNEIPATIVATDPAHDLALLRLDKKGPYPAATFGRSDDLMPGETVIAIGSPVGLGRTVTTGIVSALNRSVPIEEQVFEGLIQTDAAVNRGNSGGALLNILGEWIGVNSAISSMSGGSDGISFAIPIETVKSFLSRAIQTGRVTGRWAGLEFRDDASGEVRVASVFPIGPATRAGLRKGARILRIDGRPVTNSALATLAVYDATARGKVEVTVADGASEEAVTLPLEAPPTERLAWERIGIKADEVTPELRQQTGYPVGSGILVREVRPDGPAGRVGIEPGDLILQLGAQTLREAEDLLEVLQWSDKGAVAPLALVRVVREQVRTPFGIQVRTRLENLSAKVALE